MTLTLAHKTVKSRPRKVKNRKAALRRAGHTYGDLARLADVTYSMAWKWMNDERVSGDCERAYETLIASARKTKAS